MRQTRYLAVAAIVMIGAFINTGCNSQRQLDPSGPYMGDAFLYQVDGLIVDIGEAVKLLDQVAARNPAAAARADVAPVLAKIRRIQDGVVERNADGTIKDFESLALLIVARDAYVAVKTQATADAVTDKARLVRLILDEARSLLPLLINTPQ